MEETDNYKADFESAKQYRELIETKSSAHHVLTRYDSTSDNTHRKAALALKFKKHVNYLALELEAAYQERDDLDKPDILKEMNYISPQFFTVNEGRVLMRSFRDLMQKLGVTSLTRRQYELKSKGAKDKNSDDGKGAVNKNE